MNYVSVATLNRDAFEFAQRIPPEVDSIVGIERSGLLAASLVAKYANKSMLPKGKILLMDDSVLKGRAMAAAKKTMVPYMTAAMYVKPGMETKVDLYHKVVPCPRFFEWNLWHHPKLSKVCMDIDGVLCRDPTRKENDNGPEYERFIESVEPRIRPQVTIGWLVTCRLEQYRPQTEAWLKQHAIRYKHLVMCPGIKDRKRHKHSHHKVKIYTWTKALLFIESSLIQATNMKLLTERPVLCTETMELV